ncbi:MAG: beta-Ala-His dipeptidase [Candidatus Helarchaeota archaeon]|nr:beta-Ala-His dipeptidase [Candidatus Helarchaeota archaeon]
MIKLDELGEPSEFWDYFFQISQIPHASGCEGQVREFIRREAEKFDFEAILDKAGNLLIKVPSKERNSKKTNIITIQSHMDMVCEKNDDIIHDFSKDPLKLKVIEINNEKWLTAEGTTLGADNAVGMAYQLTLMKRIHSKELDFGPLELELLFTVSEEAGMFGALGIDKNTIKGKYLINLDSEGDDTLCCGCAGGTLLEGLMKLKRIPLSEKDKNYTTLKLEIEGLIGGHSGVDIHKGRANAIKLLSEILWKIDKEFQIHINQINGGGSSFNAIPRESYSIFFTKIDERPKIQEFVKDLSSKIKGLYEGIEINMNIILKEVKNHTDFTHMPLDIQKKVLDVLYLVPNGPISFHPKTKGVNTSVNIGYIQTKKRGITFAAFQRSSNEYDNKFLYERMISLMNLAGFKITKLGSSPSWTPDFNSKLLQISKDVYNELFHEEAKIRITHGILECSFFNNYFPNTEIIAIGPSGEGAHSPDERLKVNSVSKVWKFLLALLNKIMKE